MNMKNKDMAKFKDIMEWKQYEPYQEPGKSGKRGEKVAKISIAVNIDHKTNVHKQFTFLQNEYELAFQWFLLVLVWNKHFYQLFTKKIEEKWINLSRTCHTCDYDKEYFYRFESKQFLCAGF